MRRTIGGNVEALQQPLGSARCRRFPFEAREQREVLARTQPVVEGGPLWHPADADTADTFDPARARLERTGEDGEQRRLPRTVRPDQGERLA